MVFLKKVLYGDVNIFTTEMQRLWYKEYNLSSGNEYTIMVATDMMGYGGEEPRKHHVWAIVQDLCNISKDRSHGRCVVENK